MSRLIVKNLPKTITEEKIRKIFGEKGEITDVQLKYKDGKFRQFGFVGFKDENIANEVVNFFDGTYVGSSKVKVELCAGLGDESKPKSWSKYAKDSEAFKKKNAKNEVIEELPVEDKKPGKKKKKAEKIDEIIGDHKDDPLFEEFLKSHAKDKLLWENDIAGGKSTGKSEDLQESKAEEVEIEEKLADAKISDSDYMKQLMGETVEVSEKPPKAENHVKLYTVKIRNIPKKSKRGDLIKFFRPAKAHSVRIPPKSNFAYVGFKLESELKRALNKDKSFLKGKQVHVYDFTDQQGDQPHKKEDKQNVRWQQQEQQLEGNEDICETGKLFFRNLAYSVTEEDLLKLFETYGPVAELNLPVDNFTRKIKGFGTVVYVLPQNAVTAYTELNGSNFHGRMFHLIPGKSDDKPEGDDEDYEGSNYKKKKQSELKKSAQSGHNWNTLFLGVDAVAEVMSRNYGKSKEEILDTSTGGTSAAVRIALGETQIVLEMKKFLEDQGVRLEVFDEEKPKRSKSIIIAKNLPPGTTESEMREKFSPFGAIERIVLPPSGVTCLIKFETGTEAKKAFVKLAYTKFKKLPLFLEWAPENAMKEKSEMPELPETDTKHRNGVKPEEVDDEPPESNSTIFIKNLSKSSTENSIREHFSRVGKIHTVQIATKKNPSDPKNPLPLGYGFIQFKLSSSTDLALKTLQFSILDDVRIELKRSDRTLEGQKEDRMGTAAAKKSQGSTKILVKNIPFQAGGNELRDIFKVFGDIKAVRLPRKIGQNGEQHRGFGFIDFVAKNDAKQALDALRHSTHLYGRRLVLEWADSGEDVNEIRKRTAQQASTSYHNSGPPKKKPVIEGDDYIQKKSDDEDGFD